MNSTILLTYLKNMKIENKIDKNV